MIDASVKVVTTPLVVIRPIELLPVSVNHRLSSGPVAIACGELIDASVKLVTTPLVVIRPIESFPSFVNHRLPSGPVAIACR